MEQLIEWVEQIQNLVWGPATIFLLLGTGIYFTIGTGFFQVRRMRLWMRYTLFAIFGKGEVHDKSDPGAISQFQAVTTALAGTIGTGNIVGVATALAAGGSGAVFWMWVSALFGMMTKYAENVLGNRYRYRDAEGWKGGPMVYIERGLGWRWMACIFSAACVLASFGIGNMAQANSIAGALHQAFSFPPYLTGLLLMAVTALTIFGGVKRIGALTERFVPFMALGYLAGGAMILFLHRDRLPDAFASIFSEAFSLRAAAGGAGGIMMMRAMRFGVARGIFSNEAGLGSSVIVGCASNVKDPVRQGMWGIFEVFADTIVVCTVTALCILVTGAPATASSGAALSMAAFTLDFKHAGALFLSLALACFAFSTLLGWSYYGERALESLVGPRLIPLYKTVFILLLFFGCTTKLELIWAASDVFNGFMAIPNLIALLLLSPEVFRLTRKAIIHTA